MFKKAKLGDIAQIYSGYAFRGAIKSVLNGAVSVLQAKDIIQNEPFLNSNSLTKISLALPRSNSYILNNDVLLVSRATGPGNFRATFFESDEKNVIASSSVFIIRMIDKAVLPKYISFYLNSSDCQNDLAQLLSGSYIKTVPRRNLEQLQILIPPLHIQKSLVDLNENIMQQGELLNRKNKLMKIILNATFKNLTHT